MEEQVPSEARERVLRAAERLFSERGYKAVTMRDIANEVGMKPASLYNHAPRGKEDLFIAITERNLARHRAGIEQAIVEAAPELRSRLRAIGRWLLSQPPTNLQRMQHSDMPAIAPAEAERLSWLAYQSILAPVAQLVREASEQGEIDRERAEMLPGTFVVAIEGVRDLEQYTGMSEELMANTVIDLLLQGAYPR